MLVSVGEAPCGCGLAEALSGGPTVEGVVKQGSCSLSQGLGRDI